MLISFCIKWTSLYTGSVSYLEIFLEINHFHNEGLKNVVGDLEILNEVLQREMSADQGATLNEKEPFRVIHSTKHDRNSHLSGFDEDMNPKISSD